MFNVTRRDDAFTCVELEDTEAQAEVTIAPGRGGMATRFRVKGRDVLYLDASTLDDRTKNVRGGNPVLFPCPGKLEADAWKRDGREGRMKQHGFARNAVWGVADTKADDAASVTLSLSSSPETRESYPWDFRVDLTYRLSGATLRIEPRVHNTGDSPMPFGFGFHPYFYVQDKTQARIATRATRAFDNVKKSEVAFTGFDFSAQEVDLHLLDHGSTESERTRAPEDGGAIRVRGSREFSRWVVWSLAGKDFICLEPWTCPGNALNTGESLIILSPGERRALWIEIGA